MTHETASQRDLLSLHRPDKRLGTRPPTPGMRPLPAWAPFWLWMIGLVVLGPGCPQDQPGQNDAGIDARPDKPDSEDRPDARPDRLPDTLPDRPELLDARPDYPFPDGGCVPPTLDPVEIVPGQLYRLPHPGENEIKGVDISHHLVAYSELRCPVDGDERADSFVFDLDTMTESLVAYGFGNQRDIRVAQSTAVYSDDTLAWPPFSDDPNNLHRYRIFEVSLPADDTTLLLDGNWFKLPVAFNGQQLVYQTAEGLDPSSGESYYNIYDLETGQDHWLADHAEDSLWDMTDRHVTWVGRTDQGLRLFYHDIQAGQTVTMDRHVSIFTISSVSDRYLVWNEADQAGDWDIWVLDLATQQIQQLARPDADQGFPVVGHNEASHLIAFWDYSRSGARYIAAPYDIMLLDMDTGIRRRLTHEPDNLGAFLPSCRWEIFSRINPSSPRWNYLLYAWNLVEAGVLDDSCHVIPCDSDTQDCTELDIPPWGQ